MEKGINLSLTRSLVDFDTLLDKAIKEVVYAPLTVFHDLDDSDSWKFQVGKYIQIDLGEKEPTLFWIGFGWNENGKQESCLWIEFDAKTCPAWVWDNLNKYIGTTGKYYSGVYSESAQIYMNSWIHFYLRKDCLDQFYDENEFALQFQKKILTGFIDEVLEHLS